MAKALWEQPITKNVDWGGDEHTGGAAVSGQYVQQFIKDTLNKKFGYLYYNRDNKKYFIFADQEDYNTWATNPNAHANLVLANFDAPAPASIKPTIMSSIDVTTLFGSDLEPIVFNYYIKDSSDNVIAEDVIMRITATSKTTGAVKSEVITIPWDSKTFNATAKYYKELKDKDGNYVYPMEIIEGEGDAQTTTIVSQYYGMADNDLVGSRYEYSRLNRLLTTADNYSISITLTTATTQVSTTLAFSYQLIELNIASDFNYLSGVDSSEKEFIQNVTITGAPGIMKYFELYIDGKPLKQTTEVTGIDPTRLTSCGDELETRQVINLSLEIFTLDKDGNPIKWTDDEGNFTDDIFTAGKHTMQMWTYIYLADGTKIQSQVLYYEFVVLSDAEQTFLLYKANLNEQHNESETLTLTGTQYSQIEYSIGVFDSRNRNVGINYQYDLEGEGGAYTNLNSIDHEVKNGEEDNIKYTLRDVGNIRLTISNNLSTETLNILIISNDSGIVINETTKDNLFKYSAENHSNSERGKELWKNTSKIYGDQYEFDGILSDKVTFNDLNGWTKDDALTLRNGATVKFGFNLFDLSMVSGNRGIENTGWTFEIDFETLNVQNDDAPILNFSDPGNKSNLVINATSAYMTTNNGVTIKTNFKEAERIKLAFIANPLKNVNAQKQYDPELKNTDDNPNTLFIMTNGVLDRVVKWGNGSTGSDSFKWTNPTSENANSFTIGNTTGEANVKIYSIRIYNRALNLDEEFMNYLNDQSGDTLVDVYQKNNVVKDDGSIDIELVKKMIPTLVMSMDYTSFGSFDATRKKDNTFAEVQFFDPNDPELNFYARQCWISCQGTSSMSYPIKNLRLYFGKTANKNTFQVIDQISQKDENGNTTMVKITNQIPTTPEYETEFWPYSEYGAANEATVATWADEHLPYATNKKVDSTDGSMILVNKQYLNAVHNGYHKIGANRTTKGKRILVQNYLKLGKEAEFDYKDIYNKQKNKEEIIDMPKKAVSIYMVNPPEGKQFHKDFDTSKEFGDKANAGQPIIIKDAFDDEHVIYATTGVDGYVKNDDGSFSHYRTEVIDPNDPEKKRTLNTEVVYDSFIELNNDELNAMTNDQLEALLAENDLFISAYRPLLRSGEDLGSDSYKKYIDELRYSGVALYAWNGKKFKKNKDAVDYNTLYYTIGANWRQYNEPKESHVSGWTDRWTLKADYAESSMCHNGGVGRLWGNAMNKVIINNKNLCQTEAQVFVSNTIDIRTSCDGKPIVLFYNQIQNFDGDTGAPVYAPTKFAGLYNIMTDKSSTKLFGFEDITNPAGSKWKAGKTECWECLNNGSNIVKGLSTEYDEMKDGKISGYTGVKKSKLGEARPLWGTYESRWPDTGQERHEYNPETNPLGNNWPDDAFGVDTKNLEGFLRWVNFTKDAIEYTIGQEGQEIDGYKQELYKEVPIAGSSTLYRTYTDAEATYNSSTATPEEKAAAEATMNDTRLYMKWDKSGNTVYSAIGEEYQQTETRDVTKERQKKDSEGNPIFEEDGVTPIMETYTEKESFVATHTVEYDAAAQWYTFSWRVNMEVVNKSINTKKIGKKVYIAEIPSFDAQCRCDDAEGNIVESESSKHYVKTYVTPKGDGNYEYYDNFGVLKTVTAASIDLDPDNEHKISLSSGSAPVSCSGLTYMQYFATTKWDHLDVYKVAAYYIYLLRFGAVDQVVKNSMMTTEDGQHYYFINYDNDTILGVRNDGYLIYNWDIDRNSYDSSLPGYAFAGAQSVLWNNLEMDEEFMSIVKTIDNAMNKQGLLSAEAVLTMFNEKQEGVWSQRLYNEQEKIKYLSTVKKDFSTDKYLGFMHGTRHSHRNWWVNHRWDLYDAKWSSGMYSLKQMSFIYTLSASTASPQDMMVITAASKYYFTMIRNTALSYSDWFKELERDHTGVYTIRQSNSVGDPIFFYGPQKIKILNLRPNANAISRISLAEPYTIVQGDGSTKTSDWVTDDGSLMTKLLIGYDDTHESSTATDISGIDKLVSLEEVDIRGMKKLNGGVPTINGLANLHRWRAKNSNATTFIPSTGVTLYEVSLSQETTSTIELDNATFAKDPVEYESLQTHMLSGASANNATNDVENGPNETAFGKKFGDILPVYDKIGAYKYCKTYDDETHSMIKNYQEIIANDTVVGYTGDYIFDYAPTKLLRHVTFNNVKGFDTYQFLLDLAKAFEDGQENTKNCKVNLNGIEWVIEDDEDYDPTVTDNAANTAKSAVSKLIKMHRLFDYTDDKGNTMFNGYVYIKHKNDAPLTEAEYTALQNEFGTDVFKTTAAFRINSAENMFITVTGGTKYENALNGAAYNNKTYYDVVKGNEFKVNASVFPVSTEQNYVYVLDYASGFGTDAKPALIDTTKGHEVYALMNGDETIISLTNKDGEAVVYANPAFEGWGIGDKYLKVSVCGYRNGSVNTNDDWTKNYNNTVYFKLSKRVMPADNQIIVHDVTDDVDVSLNGTTPKTELKDRKEHEYKIKYSGVEPNVKVTKVFVSFETVETNPKYVISRYDTDEDRTIEKVKFVAYDDEKYVHIDNENNEFSFKLQHNITEYVDNPNQKVYFKLTFENGLTSGMLNMDYNVVCTYLVSADNIEIHPMTYNETSGEYDVAEEAVAEINIDSVGTYRYKLVTSDHNINYDIDLDTNYPQFSLNDDVIVVNAHPATTTQTDEGACIYVTYTPEIETDKIVELEKVVNIAINIAYPDNLNLVHESEDNAKEYVNSNISESNNPFIINLTNTTVGNYVLKFEANTNMAYAIETTQIEMTSRIVDNDGITHTSTTTKAFTPESTSVEFEDYKQSGDTFVGTVTFTPNVENVTLDEDSVKSVKSINLTTNSSDGISSGATFKISCKVKYDSDSAHKATQTPYFSFDNISDADKETVVFTFEFTRSICAATTWTKLKPIDSVAGQYTLYLVDDLNRFFEVPVSSALVVNSAALSNISNNSGVAKGNWRGVGFRYGNGTYTTGDNQNTAPIFVGFKQWIGYNYVNATSEIDPATTRHSDFRYNNGKFNGYSLTEKLVANASNDSTISKIWNAYDDQMRLYVPSKAELDTIISISASGDKTGEYAMAINNLIVACKESNMITIERNTNPDQTYETVTEFDNLFLDIANTFQVFDTTQGTLNMHYYSSSVNMVTDLGTIWMSVANITRTNNPLGYSVSSASCIVSDTVDQSKKRVFVPFVKVK